MTLFDVTIKTTISILLEDEELKLNQESKQKIVKEYLNDMLDEKLDFEIIQCNELKGAIKK